MRASGLTAACKETSLWHGLGCFPAGLGQAGAWGSSLREVCREDTHSFFFPCPQGSSLGDGLKETAILTIQDYKKLRRRNLYYI